VERLSRLLGGDAYVVAKRRSAYAAPERARGEGIAILTVSMDLPFAQKRWCGAAGAQNV
jgi:peroxiredoxin